MADTAYGTSGGIELTEALIERLATEAKEGYDPAQLRPRTRRRGRPPIGSEAAALFQVRLEPELREALAQAADGERTSPSELARHALRSYLDDHPHRQARESLRVPRSRSRQWLADQQLLLRWADTLGARSEFPRLLRRLILETGRGVVKLGFPAGEGVAAGGWDGTVRATEATAFIPRGLSLWELSVEKSVGKKADRDYEKRLSTPDGSPTDSCAYVAASLRRWRDRSTWERRRTAEGRWAAVRAYGLDDIETWLESAPVTHAWISEELGIGPYGLRAAESWWTAWASATTPTVTADLILSGRTAARDEFWKRLAGSPQLTTIAASSVEEVLAFVAAVGAQAEANGDPRLFARTAFVDDLQTWRSLVGSAGQLVLVAASDEVVAEANSGAGHHVVVPTSALNGDLVLPAIDATVAANALRADGVAEDRRAEELGHLARRSLIALRRHIANKPELHQPGWARSPVRREARGILLAGRWSERSRGDQEVLAILTGLKYEQLRDSLVAYSSQEDPFVARVDRSWSLVSPFDAWILLGPHLYEEDLKRFETAVREVLGERDPALDLPADERWRASIDGKIRTFSGDLRQGFAESLALLGVHGHTIDTGGGTSGAAWAAFLVRELLEDANADATCQKWASIADLLPPLAEAAPDAFLEAVRKGVTGPNPLLRDMFTDQGQAGFSGGHSPHTGLLWALENTAWSGDYFGHSIDLLARLAEIDPPSGRLSNRPFNSLTEIYCPWHPETSADIGRRLVVLDVLRKRHGDISWRLMLESLPEFHGTHFPTYEPRFRDWKPSREPVKTVQYLQFVADVVDRLLEDASGVDHWIALLDKLPQLPPRDRERLREALKTEISELRWESGDYAALWEAVRGLIAHHRQFADADWALPEEELRLIGEIEATIEPTDAVVQAAWLFADHMPDLGDHRRRHDFQEYESVLAQRRRDAVADVLRFPGLEGVRRLAADSRVSWAIGVALADANADRYEDELLHLVDSQQPSDVEVGLGYAGRRFGRDGWDWIERVLSDPSSFNVCQRARLLLATRDFPRAWEVADLDDAIADCFWKHFSPYGLGPDFPHVRLAAGKLLEAARPAAALRLLVLYAGQGVEQAQAELTAITLEKLLASELEDAELRGFSRHDFEAAFEVIEPHADTVGWERIARLQWAFLPALGFDPKAQILQRLLSTDPIFFVDVVSKVYRAKSDEDNDNDSPERAHMATNGYRLLSSWSLLPGLRDDDQIDGEVLRAWIAMARTKLIKAGRLDVGEMHIGHILASSPSDPDGRWPAATVRDLFEELQSQRIEEGFTTQTLNNRGITTRSLDAGGTLERDLVSKYRSEAAQFIDEWPRTAAILRRLAMSYEQDARREEHSAERFRRGLR